VAERDRLQLGKPVAAAGAAKEDRQLVANESAAAVSEDGWTIDHAWSVLLVATGERASDTAVVRGDSTKDCRLARADRIEHTGGR
jgi:hypothetical protein